MNLVLIIHFQTGTLVLGVVGVVGQLVMLAVDLAQLLEPGDEELSL